MNLQFLSENTNFYGRCLAQKVILVEKHSKKVSRRKVPKNPKFLKDFSKPTNITARSNFYLLLLSTSILCASVCKDTRFSIPVCVQHRTILWENRKSIWCGFAKKLFILVSLEITPNKFLVLTKMSLGPTWPHMREPGRSLGPPLEHYRTLPRQQGQQKRPQSSTSFL